MDDREDEHVPVEIEKLADSSSTVNTGATEKAMWVFTFVSVFDVLSSWLIYAHSIVISFYKSGYISGTQGALFLIVL